MSSIKGKSSSFTNVKQHNNNINNSTNVKQHNSTNVKQHNNNINNSTNVKQHNSTNVKQHNSTNEKQNNSTVTRKKNILTPKRFIDLFFREIRYRQHVWFYILKEEVKYVYIIQKIKEIVKKLKKGSIKIPLKIDPNILELCKSGKDSNKKSGEYLKKYFTNEKQKNFRELYMSTMSQIHHGSRPNNYTKLLTINNQNNSIIQRYLDLSDSSTLKETLISEIRLRKFAIECGFTTWEQLKNMFRFLKYIYKNELEEYFDFNSPINTSNNYDPNSNNNNNPGLYYSNNNGLNNDRR